MEIATLENVKAYYGQILNHQKDLRTNACCTTESIPTHLRTILSQIQDEILDQFYGCGSPIPHDLEGRVVLDLGCGTGRDVYLASKLVGSDGYVIGVDMTPEQLEVARRHVDAQTRRFGYDTPNVDFRQGYIEDLLGVGIADASVDVVISNCVINLSPDKEAVFSEIFRVLKPGGELYFSDVFTDRRMPADALHDPILQGECLAGAMYTEDFRRLVQKLGCLDYRVVSESPIEIGDPALERRIGMVNFTSKTIRIFKLDTLEDICEDYGQVAIYQGTIPEAPHRFVLDDHHIFETGKPVLVCGNSAAMVQETRFGRHFQILGDRSTHYGAFDCAPSPSDADSASGSCC